jgi:hypothetical protein
MTGAKVMTGFDVAIKRTVGTEDCIFGEGDTQEVEFINEAVVITQLDEAFHGRETENNIVQDERIGPNAVPAITGYRMMNECVFTYFMDHDMPPSGYIDSGLLPPRLNR